MFGDAQTKSTTKKKKKDTSRFACDLYMPLWWIQRVYKNVAAGKWNEMIWTWMLGGFAPCTTISSFIWQDSALRRITFKKSWHEAGWWRSVCRLQGAEVAVLLFAPSCFHLNLCWRTAAWRKTRLGKRTTVQNLQSFSKTFSERAVVACLTHVVVSRDGHGSSGAGTLLGEVVAEFEDAGVVFQHGGDLHLDWVSQLLPLYPERRGDLNNISTAALTRWVKIRMQGELSLA